VDSAEAAIDAHDRGESYDAIVSDIEMPGMNGFDLVSRIRSGGRWEGLPIVAMSSRTTHEDLERGHEVGFTDYVAKNDRDGLLQALSESLEGGLQ
jgi:two-component system chemotaxis sensor kinase CheA